MNDGMDHESRLFKILPASTHSPTSSIGHDPDEFRLVRSRVGHHLFMVDGSRFYDLDVSDFTRIQESVQLNGCARIDLLPASLPGGVGDRYISAIPLQPQPVYSISINVAQACNMACRYCYADEGRFGGEARFMCEGVANQAVDSLICNSLPDASILLGFMGGEPLLNRRVIHSATRYAAKAAQAAGRKIRFSITTNGTLITEEDAKLFSEYPFIVQVSLDGPPEINDEARPLKGGSGSYERVIAGLEMFSRFGRPKTLSCRVTVTPSSGRLLPILEHLISLGFDDVGFSPVLVSPDPKCSFSKLDFDQLLVEMAECALKTSVELAAGRPFPFSNFLTALSEIHKGTHRPYPCGAGATYLSVNTEGILYACHRLVDDPAFEMGDLANGPNYSRRRELLKRSHVDTIEPCRACWARYLCGGGCYHEVSRRGRVACDYIRGWLDVCLASYAELSTECPEMFEKIEDVKIAASEDYA